MCQTVGDDVNVKIASHRVNDGSGSCTRIAHPFPTYHNDNINYHQPIDAVQPRNNTNQNPIVP